DGVAIVGGASGNSVGGPLATQLNLISDNGEDGVFLSDPGTTGNLVQGNYVGTEITATDFLGNAGNGVTLANGASANTIGGPAATGVSSGNLISGNRSVGVYVADTGTSANLVQGNRIGTNAAGTAALANGSSGVQITLGASANTIGGAAAARNVISG